MKPPAPAPFDADDATWLLRRIGRTGLLAHEPLGPLEPDGWHAVFWDSVRNRTLGLLAVAVRRGELVVTDEQRDELLAEHQGWMAHQLMIERLLLQLHAAFDAAGLEHRVMKGPALANTIYPSPEWRVFGDVDLVVPSSEFGRAKELVVKAADAAPPWPELRPGFDERFAKESLLRVGNLEVDLHRTIVSGPFGLRVPSEELFVDPQSFTLGSVQLLTMSPMVTFLQAALNAALGDVPPRMSGLRDVAQLLAVGDLGAEEVVAAAQRWEMTAALQRAVLHTWAAMGLDPGHELFLWARTHRPSRREAFLLGASVTTNRSYTRQAANVMVIRGVRPKAAYLRAIAAPQASYLRARGWDRGRHIKRAYRALTSR